MASWPNRHNIISYEHPVSETYCFGAKSVKMVPDTFVPAVTPLFLTLKQLSN